MNRINTKKTNILVLKIFDTICTEKFQNVFLLLKKFEKDIEEINTEKTNYRIRYEEINTEKEALSAVSDPAPPK